MMDNLTPTDAEIASAFGVDSVDEITDEMLDDVETPDTPDTVDVSNYSTAAGAAKATAEALREWAEFYGHDPDAVEVYDLDETREVRDMASDADAWTVAWEGGPSQWATALTGGCSLSAYAGPGMGYDTDPEVDGLLGGDGFDVECYYSFDLQFYNR